MSPNPVKHSRIRLVVVAAIFAAGLVAGRVTADQPRMQAALDSLRTAERELQAADNDKGGHRQKAMDLVRKAIEQVEKGIQYDRKH